MVNDNYPEQRGQAVIIAPLVCCVVSAPILAALAQQHEHNARAQRGDEKHAKRGFDHRTATLSVMATGGGKATAGQVGEHDRCPLPRPGPVFCGPQTWQTPSRGKTKSKILHNRKIKAPSKKSITWGLQLAERVGFEPTVVLPLRLISSQANTLFRRVD